MEQHSQPTGRRTFLKTLTTLSAALAGSVAAAVGVGFLYPVPRRKPRPLFVCLESEIPPGRPREITDPRGRKVLLMRRDSGELAAFGTVCPHLGCSVYYRPQIDRFECPCHQGVFDGDGAPISGPPTEPLGRYPVEIRSGKVFIQFT